MKQAESSPVSSDHRTRHPAKFSDALLVAADEMLDWRRVPRNSLIPPVLYDPFAGTGKGVEYFHATGQFAAFGTELEPEWATQSGHVLVADSLTYMLAQYESRTLPMGQFTTFTPVAYLEPIETAA